jgi:hypothetical protein
MNTRISFSDMPFVDNNTMGRQDLEMLFIGHLNDSFLCMKDWVDRGNIDKDDMDIYDAYLKLLRCHLTYDEYAAMIDHLTVEKV